MGAFEVPEFRPGRAPDARPGSSSLSWGAGLNSRRLRNPRIPDVSRRPSFHAGEMALRLDRVKLEGCGLSPTGLRTKLGNRFVAGLVALSTSLKSWFQPGLELWKEMPMRKALEFGLRVVVFETLYAIGASYASGALPG